MFGEPPSLTRRTVLAATGGGLPLAGLRELGRVGARSPVELRVRVYPDRRLGWGGTARDVQRHLRRSLEWLRAIASKRLDRPVEVRLDRGPVVPRDPLDFDDETRLHRSFRDWLDGTDAPEGPVAHLFLADAPFSADLGYGIANTHVRGGGRLGAQAVANVGATEFWDDRTVSRNMAIHEVLHTLVRSQDARAVNGSGCEHDLGAAVGETPDRVFVTPLATSYAGAAGGDETTWHGTGCFDHDRFSQYDARSDLETTWHHTWVPSDATCDAVVRYLQER
ncbi:MAG: hypothetical protein V5A33_03355 [Halobacteriales archaeon]